MFLIVQETAGSNEKKADSGEMPEVDACGRFLLWMATVVSCCTITVGSRQQLISLVKKQA